MAASLGPLEGTIAAAFVAVGFGAIAGAPGHVPFWEMALSTGVGRVFLDHDDYEGRFAPSQSGRFRVSGGPGIRITLSQALVARIDVGFSNEETGIVYLAFGHTF